MKRSSGVGRLQQEVREWAAGVRDGPPPKRPRTSTRSSSAANPIIVDHDGEGGGIDENNREDNDEEELQELGKLYTKIVGVQYYSGIATEGENVVIVREPNNRYDKNAFRIDNQARIQVGHIPRTIAEKLAGPFDAGKIRIEGTVASGANRFAIPLHVHLFSPAHMADEVRELLRNEGVVIKPSKGNRREATLVPIPDRDLLMAEEQWRRLIGNGQQIDKNKGSKILETLGLDLQDIASLRKAPHPDRIKTPLLGHQLQALYWLTSREHPRAPGHGITSQFWTMVDDPKLGHAVYRNLATGFTTRNPPTLAIGGILADDMGLGKTLSMLALIVSDPSGSGVIENPGQIDESYSKATLVVAPVSVVGNWEAQIASHVDSLNFPFRVHVYHGSKKERNRETLAEYDVVITTYQTAANDCPKEGAKKKGGIFGVKWRRVVLDEGHLIKNQNAKMTQAVCRLDAERRWVLSGTPIQNTLNDLYSIVKFLQFSPLDQKEYWNRVLARPVRRGEGEGVTRLKALLNATCLRRTKYMEVGGKPIVPLPSVDVFLHVVEFDDAEREVYKAVEAQTKTIFAEAEKQNALLKNYSCFLELLLRLRQLCNHRVLAGEDRVRQAIEFARAATSSADKIINIQRLLGQEAVSRLIDILIHSQNEDCCICLDTMTKPVITLCGHFFCRNCIEAVIDSGVNDSCPMCRAQIDKTKLLEPPKACEDDVVEEPEEHIDSSARPSSKIKALIRFLNATNEKDGTIKSVVFSQWTSMLDLVQTALDDAGISYYRLDGTMSRTAREEVVNRFQSEDGNDVPKVFLVSLKCGALGLNLTRASQIFILDPWWNPTVEDQAIDRIYRIGQTRKVSCIRFVIRGTIEERVVELQDRKRAMVQQAFGGSRSETARAARLADLRTLLGEG